MQDVTDVDELEDELDDELVDDEDELLELLLEAEADDDDELPPPPHAVNNPNELAAPKNKRLLEIGVDSRMTSAKSGSSWCSLHIKGCLIVKYLNSTSSLSYS